VILLVVLILFYGNWLRLRKKVNNYGWLSDNR